MRRRGFLIGGGVMAALAAGVGLPQLARHDTGFVAARLRALLPDLRIEQGELESFAADFLTYYHDRNPRGRGLYLLGARVAWTWLPGAGRGVLARLMAAPNKRFEKELIAAFLMGTDYLEMRGDPAETVTYIALFDPYVSGCPNIFARFDDS